MGILVYSLLWVMHIINRSSTLVINTAAQEPYEPQTLEDKLPLGRLRLIQPNAAVGREIVATCSGG